VGRGHPSPCLGGRLANLPEFDQSQAHTIESPAGDVLIRVGRGDREDQDSGHHHQVCPSRWSRASPSVDDNRQSADLRRLDDHHEWRSARNACRTLRSGLSQQLAGRIHNHPDDEDTDDVEE